MQLKKLEMNFFGQKVGKICQKNNNTHAETTNA
jgi:hypothetical protein